MWWATWTRQATPRFHASRAGRGRVPLALAAITVVLVPTLIAALVTIATTHPAPRSQESAPPLILRAASEGLTNSDADTLGPGPTGVSATNQDYDVDCSASHVLTGPSGERHRRETLSITVSASPSSISRVTCGDGAS